MQSKKHTFSFISDKKVSDYYSLEALSIRDGIYDVVEVAGMRPVLENAGSLEGVSLSKIVNMHRNQSGNIEVGAMADRLIANHYPSKEKPKYLLIFDEIEVYTRNDIGSYVIKEEGLAIQSLSRFVGYNNRIKNEVYRHIGRHTYAHIMGLNGSASSDLYSDNKPYSSHCNNECTMQKMSSIKETIEHAESLRNRKLAGFCLKCVEALRGH